MPILFLLLSIVLATLVAAYLMSPQTTQVGANITLQESANNNHAFTSPEPNHNKNPHSPADTYDLGVQGQAKTEKRSFLSNLFSSDDQQTQHNTVAASESVKSQYDPVEHKAYLQRTYHALYTNPGQSYASDLPSISGRVLNGSGKPLAGISVVAKKRVYYNTGQKQTSNKPGALHTVSNENGFYAFRDLVDGIYLLRTDNNKRYKPEHLEVRTGVNFADIVLNDTHLFQVSGVVVNAETGQVLPDVKITPLVKGVPPTLNTNARGAFQGEIDLGNANSFALRLQKEGYRKEQVYLKVAEFNPKETRQFMLYPAQQEGALTGELVGQTGGLMQGIQVQLYSSKHKTSYQAKTNSAGEFNFDNVELGDDYHIWVRPTEKYRDYSEKNVSITRDRIHKRIELQEINTDHTLSGRVSDLDNKPVSNLSFLIRSAQARHQSIPVTTDDQGYYHAENVPEGDLLIESGSTPHYSIRGIKMGAYDGDLVRNLVIDTGQEKLLGKIVDESGDPVPAPRIHLTSIQFNNGIRSSASRSTRADAEGKFLFTDLGAELYTITVNAPGYKSTRLNNVNISSSQPLVVRLDGSTG
ncbi:MAG: carboxypeptidase-like regulatory domain-containing protein [Gammaproteobacteria bacterium]|nr:carboxypeptidase-like regulatory domain-containing protein [Gammaproteobacteria bacterium]NNM12836.1 carboxypeptidase regulatory-like domain-containing protein [Gammaproteobacteria bacterium]